ncbi:MAG: hypothetical protein GY913_33250 [Proteobacteria bacterium]|nr:hypothetical protein [Pseudomonadota bacterium]MCP4921793.1 hypothetical protein [Pseudomonadota bacterium]
MFLLSLALQTSTAQAQQPEDVELVRVGQDIEAWRELDTDDVGELSEFVSAWPSSKLSVLAAQKLDAMGEVADLSKSDLARLDAELADHSANLKAAGRTSVATLDVGSQGTITIQDESERRLHPQVELGGTGALGSAGMYLHAGFGGDHLGVAVRGTASQAGADLGVAFRATVSPYQLSPYAELIGTLRDPALGGALGVRQPLDKGFALSLAVETMVVGVEPQPTVRFGASKAF